jgi:hypothetical protein
MVIAKMVVLVRVMQAAGIGTLASKITAGFAFSIMALAGPAIVLPPGVKPSPCPPDCVGKMNRLMIRKPADGIGRRFNPSL